MRLIGICTTINDDVDVLGESIADTTRLEKVRL